MRELVCNRCREVVSVFEEPCEFIDPVLFTCSSCLQPVPGQMELDDTPRTETRQYDPAVAEIGF